MKKLVLSFLFFSFAAIANASTGGPDAYGYIWKDNGEVDGPVYNWIDITTAPGAVQILGLGDDDATSFIQMGFQFPYYWYNTSQFKIGSNGYIIFSNGAMASPFPAIPLTAIPNDFISAFGSDLNFSGVGNIAQCWYWSNSVDTLIVSWIDVPFWINSTPPYTGANTFQMILSKVDSSITFQYEQQQGTSAAVANFLTIGIENITGSVGLQHSYGIYPPEATAIKFYFPQGSTFAVNDASTSYCNNSESGGLFIGKDAAPLPLTAQIKNTGNQSLSPFNVNFRVLNSANLTQVTQTKSSTALVPGQTEDIAADSVFRPTTVGTFKFRTTTLLSGDASPTNNSKTLELRVVDTTQNFVTLSYTGVAPVPAGAGISWQGGDAGVGVEIVPPYYPCYIRRVEVFITANATVSGCYTLVYDNQGPGGGPGNLLDSTYVNAGDVLVNAWNVIDIPSPIQVDSGSVYLGWMMDGEGITLGTDSTSPISFRSYEILGSWSIYRSRETTDPMIRMVISPSPTATTEEHLSAKEMIGEFYPSPTEGHVRINLNLNELSDESLFSFYDLQGKLVESKMVMRGNATSRQSVSFDLSKLDAGMYVCKIVSGNQEFNRKLLITN